MKILALIAFALSALGLVACGGNSGGVTIEPKTTTTSSVTRDGRTRSPRGVRRHRIPPGPELRMSKRELAALPSLTIARRSGPPPKRLTIIDLRKGTGRAVTKRDAIVVRYFDVKYGESTKASRTGLYGPTKFGMNEVVKGWELGLPGMKVGGRRELIVPPKLGYRGWTLIYLVDLIAIEPGGAGSV